MRNSEEENLRLLQKWIPEATKQNVEEFRECMNSDAILKCAVPVSITSAFMSYLLVPKHLGGIKSVIVTTTGLLSYTFGKLVFGGAMCQDKVFGKLAVRHPRSPDYMDSISQEDQQNRFVTSDKLLENDSSWTNFDPYLDSNVSYFDDTGSNFQEEPPVEQPVEEKKHITYDELWAQHRGRQIRWKPTNKEAPVIPQQTFENSPPSKSTVDEEIIESKETSYFI